MAPFKSTELKSDWRSDFLIEETDCKCEDCGCDPCIECGESHHNIDEEVQGGVSVETYTKDTKFTEIETVDIIKAKPLVSEGNRTRRHLGSGNKKDMSKGPNEAAPVDYRFLVNKGKKTVDPKKNEVIAASYEIGKIQLPKINREETESQQSLVEEVFVEDYMTDLYNEGYSVDEINEYLLEEYEIEEEYLEEAWGKVLKGLGQIAGKALKSGAETVVKRAVKDTGKTIQTAKKVRKFVTNPKNLARANQDTQKVIDTGTAIVKGGKEAMARTYAAGYKTGQLLRKPAQLPGVKTFKQLASDIEKTNKTTTIGIRRAQVKGDMSPGVADRLTGKAKKIEDANTRYINRQSTGKTTTATATKPEPTVTTVKSPAKSPTKQEPKVTTVKSPAKKVDKRKGALGDAWSQFPKKKNKQLGLPKKPVDRTNKLLPVTKSSAGALPAGNTKGLLPAGKKGGPISKAQSTSVVSSPGGKVVQSKGGKLTKEVKPNERKLSVVDKLNKAKRGEKGKGTTYTSKGVRQLPPSDDPTKTKVAAASLGLGSYGGYEFSKKVGLIGKKEKKEVKEAIALAVPAGIGLGKTALKVGGAVLAAKGGSELLKKLLGSKKKPVRTDWDTNPKDDIDRELNVKQGQAKDRAKYKNFDKKVRTAKRAKDAGNISDDKYKELMSDAAKSRPKANESFSNWRSDLEVVDESAKVMLKVGKRVWKTPGVKKFLSKVPSNLSRTTKIKPITKSHALTKQTKSFGVQPLKRGRKAGEKLAPDRTTLKLDSNMGRPKPKNMALNTETGDYVPKLKKSNYELVPGAKYGDKVMAKNYGQERFEKKFRESIKKAQEKLKEKEAKGPIRLKDIFGDGSTQPKGIKDKRGTNQAALKTLKKSDSHK